MDSNLKMVMDDDAPRFEQEVKRLLQQGYRLYGRKQKQKIVARITGDKPTKETVYVQTLIKP